MSKIRKNIEYYRLPSEVETDMDSPENVPENYNVVNQGDVAVGTDRIIQNVDDGVDDNDAVNVSQLNGSAPDLSIYTLIDGTRDFTGDQDMGGNQLTDVGAPSDGGDAANKTYVDGTLQSVVDACYYDMIADQFVTNDWGQWGYQEFPNGLYYMWGAVTNHMNGTRQTLDIPTQFNSGTWTGTITSPPFTWPTNWSYGGGLVMTPVYDATDGLGPDTLLSDYQLFRHSFTAVRTIGHSCLRADGTPTATSIGFTFSFVAKPV